MADVIIPSMTCDAWIPLMVGEMCTVFANNGMRLNAEWWRTSSMQSREHFDTS